MELVPSKEIGAGNFVIGNTKLLPAVTANPTIPASFQRSQKLNFWMQVYNLGIDEKSRQNAATIQYQIIDLASNKAVLDMQEDSKKLSASSDQVTLERSVPLANLQPGKYQIRIKVNDSISNQEIAESAPFTVE
jgi:hypothetical protein